MGKCMSKQSSNKNETEGTPEIKRERSTVKQHSYKSQTIQAKVASKMQGVHELKMNYKIEDRQIVLGSGAFGKVFLSNSIHNKDLYVAIKVLDKDKLKYDLGLVMAEVAVLNKLDHPNIVKYIETYNDYKFIYLVMEYIKGKQLFKYLAEQTDHSEKRTCGYMLDIVRAIAHCHAQNVIHRDIKPENIMVDKESRVKLLDFGLSKNAKGVKDQQICGTPFYMAPEMILGEYYDVQVDIWSLGVLLYSIVSGHMPFPAESQDELFARIALAKFKFEHKEFLMVSDECKDLISKMLVKDPKKRLTAT